MSSKEIPQQESPAVKMYPTELILSGRDILLDNVRAPFRMAAATIEQRFQDSSTADPNHIFVTGSTRDISESIFSDPAALPLVRILFNLKEWPGKDEQLSSGQLHILKSVGYANNRFLENGVMKVRNSGDPQGMHTVV